MTTSTTTGEAQREKILRMFDAGFKAAEIQRACAEKWPQTPYGVSDVKRIIAGRAHS